MSQKFNIRRVGDVAVVDATGRIAMGTAAAILRETLRELAANGHSKVVVNMAEVLYIDSCGVGELVAGCTSIVTRGGSMKLLNVPERMQILLRITKLHTVFQVFDDEAAAVNSFG